jgi:carboxypeptidase family protein
MGLWLALGVAVLLFGTGCRRAVQAVDFRAAAAAPQGTITGIVRGPLGTPPVGRTVEIVNTATGQRRIVRTGDNGGFTVVVPAGRYRLDVPLRDGETMVKRPGIIDMDKGDTDSSIEFVVGPTRASHPRGPAYHVDNGLGSPVA